MFNLSTHQKIRRISFVSSFCLILIAVFALVIKNIITDANAANTADNATVTVSFQDEITYGSGNSPNGSNTGWQTHNFTVQSGNKQYTAFCANPSKGAVANNFPANVITSNSDKNKQIKLMIYLYMAKYTSTVDDTTAAAVFDNMFSTISNQSQRYAWTHATIGYINSDGSDTAGLSTSEKNFVKDARDTLKSKIDNQDIVWLRAKYFQLYGLDPNSITNDQQNIVWIENSYFTGNVKVEKRDSKTNGTAQGNASLSGIKFSIYNDSGEKIVYGDTVYDTYSSSVANSLIATKTTNASGELTFSGLPGKTKYRVVETATNTSYTLTSSSQTVTISTSGETKTLTFNDDVIRGNVKFKKVDKNNNNAPMANIPFRITSDTTGESHIVVTNSNGVVDTSANSHSNHTNGYDSISDPNTITYQGYGTWFGKNGNSTVTVDDSLGALPYDTYTIKEIACDQNKYCYDIDAESTSFTVSSNNVTVDLGTWDNECANFSLSTTASDNEDEDKYVNATATATIKDKVDYCLKTGHDFILKGILMDKSTSQPVVINNSTVEASLNINSATACGETMMTFTFDASELAGKEIVVFERLYDGNELIIEHADINDENQFVRIVSLDTTAKDKADEDQFIEDDPEVTIVDTIDYCLKAGQEFTILGTLMDKTTGEPVLINDEAIQNTLTFTPEEDCGSIDMEFTFDATGLGGVDLVVFEKAYSDDTFETLIVAHEDINDDSQLVEVLSLNTVASSKANGTKTILAEKNAVAHDLVTYCLRANREYIIKSTLVNKNTGKPIATDKNGDPIIKEVTITPEENCGETTIDYEFDATGLGGTNLVFLEAVFYNDEPIIIHDDLNNESQTVSIVAPEIPDTGFTTSETTNGQQNNPVVLIVISASLLLIVTATTRALARRKIFR
ncbi:VaFE repeat-containing surface-anchored protein [Candidatus Saccharibacteria bacterium]|nr:VaFE repeat-containing surface-anchored protein [Candidatus Saccharibacteria bacterium]